MAADNSAGHEQRQDFELDFGLYHQNADNNLIGNGIPQAAPNDNVAKFSNEIIRELGSSCGSTAKPSLNQVNFNMNLSISSTPRNPFLLESFQLNSQSSEEPTESSTPQSRPSEIEENQITAVGNNHLDHSDFMLRSNHRCLLRNETMINVTTDVNAPNMMRVEVEAPNSGTVVMEAPTHPYSPRQAEMVVQNTKILVQSFPPHHHEPQSASQPELLQPQMVAPISQSCTFYGNHFGLNIQNNNMINSLGDQQAHFYPPPYSQTTMGIMDGRSSWNNHQQPWLSVSYNSTPHRPINATPSGPRYSQFMGANIFGSPSSNFLSNGPSLQSRPMQPTIWHQVPAMSNSYDPYFHTYSMAHVPPAYTRFQSFSHPYNHQASMTPNIYDTQGWNFMPPPESSFQMRPQNFGRHQVPNGMNPQNYNSVLPCSSMPSRFQQFNGYNQHINSVNYGVPNVSDPQNYINPRHEPLLLTGPPQASDVQQGMMTHGSQNQQQQFSIVPEAPIMSSFSQQLMDRGEVNGSIGTMPQLADPLQDTSIVSGGSVTSKPWTNQLQELSKNQQHQILISEAQEEKRVRGRRSRRRNRFEFGESSSSSSKRIKRESTTTETCPLAVSPQRGGDAQESEGTSRFANPRQIKSEIYDPMFEEMGLPIDPHLRMFVLS